jgi:F-type H+-transporting ATPase subunit delta
MAKLAPAVYGEALYELAVEQKKTDQLYEEVLAVQEILRTNPELSVLMNHPKVSKEEKLRVVEEVFHGRVDDEITGLFRLLLQKDRYGSVDGVLEDFVSKVKEAKGIGVAQVSSAVELTAPQKQALRQKLLDTTSYREMEVNYAVDETLIGGLVIRIGDRVVDSSIRTKLDGLKREMLEAQV